MINYWMQVSESHNDSSLGFSLHEWIVQIYANSDLLETYGGISTQKDAYLVGEAFISGIKFVRGQ